MLISIITVSYNSAKTIKHTLQSVAKQSCKEIEHIAVDGASTDGTWQIISQFSHITKAISEPDFGMYDAINKGIGMASGEVIGILNSDDFYPSEDIISTVMAEFQNETVDCVFGDIVFVDSQNLEKTKRTYRANKWNPLKFAWGFMPPHPSVFLRKDSYERLGLYKTNYKIAADYELLIRFLYVNQLKYTYLPKTLVKMRLGGKSTKNWKSNILLNAEIRRGCLENGLSTNYLKIYSKYFTKVFELKWFI